MSWRASAERSLRPRVTPELFAGGLVVLVGVAVAAVLAIAGPAGSERGPGSSPAGSTATSTAGPTGVSPAPPTEASRRSPTPGPTGKVDTQSIRAVLVLNDRLAGIAAELERVRSAKPFVATDAAGVLRRMNASVMSARDLATRLAREPRTAVVASALQTFYSGLMSVSSEALRFSLSNADAYSKALAEIAARMPELSTLNQDLNGLLN